MTSLVLGFVGGAIGFAVTGTPIGFQIGFLAGTLLGSLIDPPKVQGPKLGDLKLQKSVYGAMHPFFWGKGRISGNVMDQTDLERHKHTSGGKGGPKVETETYTASLLIGLGMTPVFGRDAIIGILRIWANGRLIWDKTTSGDIPCTVYVGSETQEADPTFEAIHGVGNQPAYRGIAYVVFTDYDMTEFGQMIPNFEFEVYTNTGDEFPWRVSEFEAWDANPDTAISSNTMAATYADGVITATAMNVGAGHNDFYAQQFQLDGTPVSALTSEIPLGGYLRQVRNLNSYWGTPNSTDFYWYNLVAGTVTQGTDITPTAPGSIQSNANVYLNGKIYGQSAAGVNPQIIYRYNAPDGVPGTYDGVSVSLGTVVDQTVLGPGDDGHIYVMNFPAPNQAKLWKFDADLNLVHFWDVADTAGTNIDTMAALNFAVHDNLLVFDATPVNIAQHAVCLVAIDPTTFALTDVGTPLDHTDSFIIPLGGCLYLDRDGVFSVCPPAAPVLLSQIVSDITENTPLGAPGSPSQMEYNVEELTDEVRWYVLASQMTARNAVQELRPIFFFDAVETDDLAVFRKRGQAARFSIPDGSLCARPYGEDAADPLLTIRKREGGLARTVTLTYIDVDTDYQPGAQSSPRQVTQSQQDVTMQVAVGLTADEALQKCLTVHTAEWVERESFEFSTTRGGQVIDLDSGLTVPAAMMTPCDVVIVRGREIRLRDAKATPNGVINFEGVLNAPSLYTQTTPGAPASGFVPPVAAGDPVDTQLVLLDIPILSLNDSPYGFYAAMGRATAGRWAGAGLYKSLDGGTSYSLVASSNSDSVIGVTDTVGSPPITGTLSAYAGGDVVEEVSLCVVLADADAELTSVTTAALLNGANLCAISRGTTTSGSPACTVTLWELLQFRDAVLVASNTYVLTGFLRGRKGTSTSGHATGDTFVLLPVLNVDAPAEEIGVCLDYKAVTFGQALGDATAVDFINTGKGADAYFAEIGDGLPPFTGDAGSPPSGGAGQVPAPAQGDCAAGKYLDACGNWSVPTGSVNAAGTTGNVQYNGGSGAFAADSRINIDPTNHVLSGQLTIDSGGVNAQTGTTYTLNATDNGGVVTLSNGSAITVTVPSGLGKGYSVICIQIGAGQVSFVASSTTINPAGTLKIASQHGAASLIAYAADVFNLSGNITA